MPDNLYLPEVDWSQQPGLLGGLTRLYHHLVGMGQIGTTPTQGLINPQEYNPVSQVVQTGQMVANPSQHKMDWLMAAAPLVGGAMVKGLKSGSLGQEMSAYFEEPQGFGEFANKPYDPVPPQYEGTNKSVIWQHAENPNVQIHHWPSSKTHPYKIYEHDPETGEDQLHYSAQTLDKAKDFANDLHQDLMAEKTWALQHGQGYHPSYEELYGKHLESLPETSKKTLGQKMLSQLQTEKPVQDYGLTPMSKAASQVPTSTGDPGIREFGNIHQIINAKDSTYHATGAPNAMEILKAGQINPGYGEPLQVKGLPKGQDYRSGVSTSRVPRIASKGTRSISFVIDPKAAPPSTSIAETGYKKTKGGESLQNIMNTDEYSKYQVQQSNVSNNEIAHGYGSPQHSVALEDFQNFKKQMTAKYGAKMNKQFEFEQRTANKPITMNSVKGIIVDKSALEPSDRDLLPQIKQMAQQRGLPYKEVSSGKELHTYRAKMSKTPKGQPMYGVAGAATAAAPGAYQLYQQMSQPQQQEIQ